MTSTINDRPAVTVRPLPVAYDVVIVRRNDFADAALLALVGSFGYRAVLADVGAAPLPACRVAIVRDGAHLARLRSLAPAIIAIDAGGSPGDGVICLPDEAGAADRLRELLATHCTTPAQDRVHLSAREREVITTYALGATIYQTARRHYISESTVRSHFRRVVARYTLAGRTVNNKSQLLVELIADGWIDQPAANASAG